MILNEIIKIKKCKEKYKRNAMIHYLKEDGIKETLLKYKNKEEFINAMVLAGFNKKYANRFYKNMIKEYKIINEIRN